MNNFSGVTIPNRYKRSAVAIGNFDGVHKGHQKIFASAKKFSKKNKIKFGIITFTPLPVMFFNKKIKNHRLISEGQKLKLFKKYGVDFVINIKFNKIFSKQSAEKFVSKIIYKKINPKFIFVSNNFKFGNKRKGNINLLKRLSNKYDYRLINTKAFKYKKKIVSSTRIRKSLQAGNVNLANLLLSRTWFIDGIVKKGKKLGRKLGFRTCNIRVKNYILPKIGIYAVKVLIGANKKIFNGVAYLGFRPTFKGKEIFLEIYIFGINKNLYKKRLSIHFVKFIRRDQKFKNPRKLIDQMNKDVISAKKELKAKLIL